MTSIIKPLKGVYCYYYPEVRKVIDGIIKKYPHETFLKSINPGLDDFHKPVIEQYKKTFRGQLPGLDLFPHQYATAGASEGIFHTLAEIVSKRPNMPIYTLDGEYEGYREYGANINLHIIQVPYDSDFEQLKPGIFFISNPSARDGNIIPNEKINEIGDAGHEIIFDATYVGMTKPFKFDITNPAIKKVLVSLSKPYGLYYYRSGLMFSKDEMLTLDCNKWFKNVLTLIISEAVLKNFKASELAIKYQTEQKKAVAKLNKDFGINAQASDVFLLANASGNLSKSVEYYRRGKGYRFCLTPYILFAERGFV